MPEALAHGPPVERPSHATVLDALEAGALDERPFLTFHSRHAATELDFRGALEGARLWGRFLHSRGVRQGDRVILLLPTGVPFVAALLGAMLVGAVPVPLATPMTFGALDRYLRTLAARVAHAEARLVVTYPRVRDALRSEGGGGTFRCDVVTEHDVSPAADDDPRLPSIDRADPAFIQYTSGTTGPPKGAVISHGALAANAAAIARGLRIGKEDVGVSWLPLFHDMGLVGVLLTALFHPYPIHLMSPESFIMNPHRWLEVASRVGATISVAPNFAFDLCVARQAQADSVDLHGIRVLLNGSEPVHPATVERFLHRFGPSGLRRGVMMPVYGMAESTLAVTFPSLDTPFETLPVDACHTAVSVGTPVAGTSVSVMSPTNATLPEGAVGEVRVKGPSLMSGYFRDDEASASVLSGGWLVTGDLGFMDRGRLFITGRAKELIIKGGRNIHPAEVEHVITEATGVQPGSVAVFGRTNPLTGTDDLVVVVETPARDPHVRERVVRATRGEVLSALGVGVDEVHLLPVGGAPRTTSGKIQRRECARLFQAREA